jgi:hypothetical protein
MTEREASELFEAVVGAARAERRALGAVELGAASSELSELELDAVTAAVLARLGGTAEAAPEPAPAEVRALAGRRRRPMLRWLALAAAVAAAPAVLFFSSMYPGEIAPTADRLPRAAEDRAPPVSANPEEDPAIVLSGGVWRPDLDDLTLGGKNRQFYEEGYAEDEDDDARAGTRWLRSKGPGADDFGTLLSSVDAAVFRGQRVRMRARVESMDTTGWAGLWMRVDGEGQQKVLAFDNMQSRSITGTVEPAVYEVVLDVPDEAEQIAFGILLHGDGQVWIDDLAFDLVPASTTSHDVGGWMLAGSAPEAYEQGEVEEYGLSASRYLRSTRPSIDGFGTTMRTTDAAGARGGRLRLSASVKSEDVAAWAGLWMRVDGAVSAQGRRDMLAFDNMEDRPIRGTTDWRQYQVVLDVPEGAEYLAFGVLLEGTGQVWFKNFSVEPVERSVRVTGSRRGRK